MPASKTIARHQTLPKWSKLVLAGVDEAGRGALAGPVVAAAVVLPQLSSGHHPLNACRDSKTLSPATRTVLAETIKQYAVVWSYALADTDEIAEKNILHASLAAMARALNQLIRIPDLTPPDLALIDGPHVPKESCLPCCAVVAGDARVKAISCASILAKVIRDEIMCQYHNDYPQYHFAKNKGYGTVEHVQALKTYGVCAIHRRGFAPIKDIARPIEQGLQQPSLS